MIENNTHYRNFTISVAGKTGTAEESENRANHGLFVCYAPYETPEIAVATRIAYGYTSSYAAKTTRDVLSYYFKLEDEEDLITGTAKQMSGSTARTD